ncbi:hypothetical protein ASE63_18490 [Bosea sp. Root381]|uniref:phage tail length tape measure family protein n=1 Tax=Bosea sp. Root381 TaxID=1736524 RepID=UPI0006F5014F|nr:phage tail length tape measure family protein [Bosea sp. Root381]KRE13462.1 hypothetical protein ASE63_18490 [Bosea sp. Root381]
MSGNEVVRVVRVKGVAEGLDQLTAKMKTVEDAYSAVARGSDSAATSTERLERRQLSAQAAYNRVQRSLDDQYRAQEKIGRVERDLQRAYDQGLVTETRRMQLMDAATQRYSANSAAATTYATTVGKTAVTANDNLTRSTGLARHEMINFGRQMQDVATMAAMGQSPFAILSSQGAQVADIFMSTSGTMRGFFAQMASGAARFALSGAGVATAGAGLGAWGVTAAAGYASGQRDVEQALRGVGAASGITLAQINRLADAQAGAARVSVASAREIAAAYAGTGRIDPGRLPGLLDFTKQYGAFSGLGTGEAATELANAFADPAKGAELLAEKLGGLNSAAQRWIREQQAAGNMLGAQVTLLESFRQQVEGSTDRVGLFARAWDGVKRSVSDADDALGRFLAGSATAEQQLAALQAQRDRFAALPTRTGRAQQHLAGLDAEIAKLGAVVELERQRAEIDARVARAANASRRGSAISDRMDTYGTALRELTADRSRLEEAMRLNPRAGDYDAWARSLDRVNGAMATMLPNAERERQTHELTIRAINARTLAERTAIEVQRETLRLSGEKISAAEREIAIQRRVAEIQAQANRDAQDALRTSRDQLALAGRSPAERSRLEIEQRYRDNVERFGGVNPAMPAATAAANGLDAAFAESLRKLREAVPGLTITSGFRTYEQQARLYAEKPHLAAPPGRSQHERGLAADLAYNGSGQLPAWVRAEAAKFGINFPIANRARNPEPWHAEPVGGRGRSGAGGGSAADEIRRNEYASRDLNAIEGVVGSANRELQRQFELLGLQRQAWGESVEEIAKAAKQQELINALQREGVAIGPGLQAQIDRTAAGYGALVRQQEELRASQEALRSIGDLGRDIGRGLYSDLRAGASGAELLTNALDKVASKLMDMAMNDLFGKAFGNNAMGLFGNGGFFSSLMGAFGGGGGSATDFSRGAGGLYGPGFASGGFTGAGGRNTPAGIVHRGEYVFSAASVNRIGLGNLDSMHRGSLPGYAGGGYVSPTPYAHQPAANANAAAPKMVVNVTNNTPAQVETHQKEDGSLEVIIDAIEGRMAQKMVRGQGSMSTAMRAVSTGRQLRG